MTKFILDGFTPDIEMDLCGHATLATAHCLSSILKYPYSSIKFETKSGQVSVDFKDGKYHMKLTIKKSCKIRITKTNM